MRSAHSFGFVNARNIEREFHVLRYGLVRYQIVTLENEAYAVIAVGVPVAVAVVFGAHVVYVHFAARVMVEPAYYV